MKLFCFFRILCLIAATVSFGGNAHATDRDKIAAVIGYPPSKVIIEDQSKDSELKQVFGHDLMDAYTIKSTDDSFLPIAVFITKKGAIFTEQLSNSLKEWLKDKREPFTTEFAIGKETKGYAGPQGLGTDGEEWAAWLSLPNKGVEIEASTFIPREKSNTTDVEIVRKRLIECIKLIATSLK